MTLHMSQPLSSKEKRMKIVSGPGRSLPPMQLAQDFLSLVVCCSAAEAIARLVPQGCLLSPMGDDVGELCKELLA